MVTLLTPARDAIASIVVAAKPSSTIRSAAASRMAVVVFSLRGRPRRKGSRAEGVVTSSCYIMYAPFRNMIMYLTFTK